MAGAVLGVGEAAGVLDVLSPGFEGVLLSDAAAPFPDSVEESEDGELLLDA